MDEALMESLKATLMAQAVLIPWLSSLGDGYLTFWLGKNLPQVWWVAFSSHSASKEDSQCVLNWRWDDQWLWRFGYGALDMGLSWDSQAT